jgi:hypothetical protein
VVIEGKGKETRGSGTAGATVTATLVGEGSTTKVRVDTELNVTGRPAQFGRGVMAEVAAKLIDQFAKCLEEEINIAPPAPSPAKKTTPAKKSATKKTAAASSTTAQRATAAKKATPAVDAAPKAESTDAPPAPSAPVPQQESTIADARTDDGPARAATPPPRRAAEPIDLMDVAGASVAKRLAPVAAAVLLLLLILRRRRRS